MAGDFGADGLRDAWDGMAPAAKLVIQDGGVQLDACADLPGLGCPVTDLVPIFEQTYDQGARIHSNSWGDRLKLSPPHNIYSAGNEDADEMMWAHKDFLLVFAAGNNNQQPGSVVTPSTAKNVIAVGSTERGAGAESLSDFSSCGFTDDGRVKPDLTNPGRTIRSANNDLSVATFNCGTRTMSGTSMATPGTAGFGALVRQYYVDGFYPSGAAVPGDAFAPSAALIKATMLNSTHDMSGVATRIPSTCQGWGRVQLDNALYLGAGARRLWVEDDAAGFTSTGERTFELEVAAGEPLRVTLTWTDFPSTPAAGAHLVNDLDLEVSGPGGTVLGNVFAGGASTAGGSPDRIDTVEQVYLLTPPAGTYTVTVRAFAIPSGPQPFALVASGDVTGPVVLFEDGFETGDTSQWERERALTSGACTPRRAAGEEDRRLHWSDGADRNRIPFGHRLHSTYAAATAGDPPMKLVTVFACALLASGIAAAGDGAATPDRSQRLALRGHEIDVSRPPAVPSDLAAEAAATLTPGAAANELALVKYPAPVGAAERRALEQAVDRVLLYLPHDAFLVRVPRGGLADLAPAGASWVGAFHPAYKISPEAAALAADPDSRPGGEPVPLMLHLDPDVDLGAAVAALGSFGAGRVVGSRAGGRLQRIRLLANPAELADRLDDLARLSEVVWIELEGRRVLLNDTTAWVGQSGTAGGQATPVHDAGIFGQGQVVAVLDTGLDADMCYFADAAEGLPVRNECNGGTAINADHRKVLAVDFLWQNECNGGISSGEWDTHDHGSHVAGTIAGDNGADGTRDAGDGMAPAAKLVIQDGGLQTDDCADLPGLGCPVVDLVPIFQQTYDQGARIHSNSWGDRENFTPHNIYSAGSEDADEFMWTHKDFLLVFAAGNEGQAADSVLSPSTAKSVISVGSTQRGASAESLSGFTSCGLTDDDRIKPDLTMPGSSIVSANNDLDVTTNNCSTRTMSGTSMAAPGVAGFAALVRQYYQDGFYPSGAAAAGDGFTPSAALIKATLLNSTHDMTGVASRIPSACQGWGRAQLDNTLYLGTGDRRLWVEDDAAGFSSAGEKTFQLEVTAGEPLRATLTWSDFPSTPMASFHLVNDLDLEVSGPGGTLLGNVFSNGVSAPGGTPDRIDTVEQVLLATPATGTYTVTVRAFAVPSGPQAFALVVSGDVVDAGAIFDDGFETGDTTAWTSSTP